MKPTRERRTKDREAAEHEARRDAEKHKKEIAGFTGDYAFLSNFWVDLSNGTVEHAYQAAKTDDHKWKQKIKSARSPGEAKKLGRCCPIRATWDSEKIDVMRKLLMAKFKDPDLAEALLETGDAILIEDNHWKDRFWGVYMGRGENWLGKLLMEVRDCIKASQKLTPSRDKPLLTTSLTFICPKCGSGLYGSSNCTGDVLIRHCHGLDGRCKYTAPDTDDWKHFAIVTEPRRFESPEEYAAEFFIRHGVVLK